MVSARGVSATQQDAILDQARVLLRRTTEVRLADGVAAIDDGPLADRLAPDTIDRELAELDGLIAFADVAASRRIDGAAADAMLHELTQAQQASDRIDLARILGDTVARIAVWVYDLVGRPDPLIVVRLQGIIGLLIAVSLVVLIVRGVRERIRQETVLGATASDRHADPSVHLRAADDALRAGHARDAIHALYLYAFASLAAHEAIRYDPALTDRELLGRAAGIPQADALRDLVRLHERVWFGLRDAREPDAAAARALALQVVG